VQNTITQNKNDGIYATQYYIQSHSHNIPLIPENGVGWHSFGSDNSSVNTLLPTAEYTYGTSPYNSTNSHGMAGFIRRQPVLVAGTAPNS
ncbi:MAG: hypothetical protein NTZ98_12155, partial [Acidobacteria bacterium]|nr:hypothetical protein [Acidobacteriota bacterium]